MIILLRRINYKRLIFLRNCHSQNFWQNGKPIEIEVPLQRENLKLSFGELARFADGSCEAQLGNTSVLVAAVGKTVSSSSSFVPLVVDYRTKTGAAGRIPTNHLRRETGSTESEILTSRIIDRSIRPLFPKGYSYDTQLFCSLTAVDGVNDPDVLSINAASAALALSDLPWNGPIGAVRVGYIDGEAVLNPTRKEMSISSLNLVVSAGENNQVVMLEASASNIEQQDFMKALEIGVTETQRIIRSIKEIENSYGKPKRPINDSLAPSNEIMESARLLLEAKLTDVLTDFSYDKVSRGKAMDVVKQEALEKLKENDPECDSSILFEAVNSVMKEVFRNSIMETGIRCDGRGLADLRNISCSVNRYKPVHGSSLFQRGQTQVLSTVALDSLASALREDDITIITSGIKERNFFLHYLFPPYATNETGRYGGYGRREKGHAALAEKSLRPVMPVDTPFTTRLTAEVLESNGSSSMATVCGGSLALMDAGVPISAPVSGVAMGLISVSNKENPKEIMDYKILTDILGLEDYLGDMDFKIAGPEKRISAAQLDIKVPGIPVQIVMETLQQASDAKSKILSIMNNTMSMPREDKKGNWPVNEKLEVPIHKRAHFRGLSGFNLKKIQNETGVTLTEMENGVFNVFAPNSTAMAEAKEIIDELLKDKAPELESGGIYTAKIVEIREYGVMVILHPDMKPALLHISQLDRRKVHHPSALNLEVGQEINVKYFGRDPADGSIRLSRKVLQITVPSPIVQNFVSPPVSSSKNSNLRNEVSNVSNSEIKT